MRVCFRSYEHVARTASAGVLSGLIDVPIIKKSGGRKERRRGKLRGEG